MRILSIWIGCACAGHHQSCLFAAGNNGLGTAVQRIKGDKISSLWLCPCSNIQSSQLLFQNPDHRLKFRTHHICMEAHMLHHTVYIFKIANMTQLIYLIMSNGLEL